MGKLIGFPLYSKVFLDLNSKVCALNILHPLYRATWNCQKWWSPICAMSPPAALTSQTDYVSFELIKIQEEWKFCGCLEFRLSLILVISDRLDE